MTSMNLALAGPPSISGQFRSYWLMVRWEMLGLRLILPLLMVVQFMVAAGSVIGFGFLFEEVPHTQALYLATGGSVVALLLLGLVAAPQMVAQHKAQRTYDFMLSLPVSRLALALASLTVWILVALPGMVLALVSAAAWYDLGLRISPLLVPAALLTVLVATSVGFAFAHALPHPNLVALISNVLVFGILMYSPINYPAERLPAWLQAVHQVLPIQHAAIVMRGALIEGMGEPMGRSFLILGVWTVVAWAVMLWVLNRRR